EDLVHKTAPSTSVIMSGRPLDELEVTVVDSRPRHKIGTSVECLGRDAVHERLPEMSAVSPEELVGKRGQEVRQRLRDGGDDSRPGDLVTHNDKVPERLEWQKKQLGGRACRPPPLPVQTQEQLEPELVEVVE